ncbi:hypothetical protein LZ32DRAFT_425361 [Colletotrichum eremochloae]|nr:hypothetical protein LZ32DRAFT_425361 [Colletotrichum eremochloae]
MQARQGNAHAEERGPDGRRSNHPDSAGSRPGRMDDGREARTCGWEKDFLPPSNTCSMAVLPTNTNGDADASIPFVVSEMMMGNDEQATQATHHLDLPLYCSTPCSIGWDGQTRSRHLVENSMIGREGRSNTDTSTEQWTCAVTRVDARRIRRESRLPRRWSRTRTIICEAHRREETLSHSTLLCTEE